MKAHTPTSAQRADALVSSIALWCGTLDEHDLKRVEAFVLTIRAEQEYVGDWVRPQGAERFCQVVRVTGGVMICHCAHVIAIHGEPWEREGESNPQIAKCGRCELEQMRRKRISGTSFVALSAADDGCNSAAGAAREPATCLTAADAQSVEETSTTEADNRASARIRLAGDARGPALSPFHLALEQFAIDCAESEQDYIRRLGETLYRSSEPEPTVIEVEMLEDEI